MKTLLLRALPLLIVAPFARAQNDECAGAIPIGAGMTPFDTAGSTTSAPAWPCAGGGGSDIWYAYTAGAAAEDLTIETCGSGYDTALEVFSGGCGALVSSQCNDDSCGLQSSVSYSALAGETVLFRVGGFGAGQGAGVITLTATPVTVGQDDCVAATLDRLVGDGAWALDNSGATTGTEGQNEALCYAFGTSGIQSDLWVVWEATVTGSVTLDTCAAGGTNADTKLAAYPGTACPADGTSVACNDDSCGTRSLISFDVVCCETYLIQAGSFPGSADGTFTLTAVQTGTPCSGFETWTQSTDNTTLILGSVACLSGMATADNSYLRLYDPVAQGTTGDFSVLSVTFGVELADEPGSGSTTITVNVRDGSNFGLFANMPIVATATVDVPDTDLAQQTFVYVPIVGADFAAGTPVALEVMSPDGTATGGRFFIGSNPLGQSGSSYIAASTCGVPDPADLATLGFPDVHLLLDATVDDRGLAPIEYICSPANPNSTGLGASLTFTGNRNFDVGPYDALLTTTQLPPNQFGYYLASRIPRDPPLPVSNGLLCLAGDIARLIGPGQPGVQNSGPGGTFSATVDTANIPTNPSGAILPGDTWYFQAWYRDQGPGPRSNFSDACCVPFGSILPVITSVSPLSGSRGDVITITGSGFDPCPRNNVVLIGSNSVAARVTDATETSLTAEVGASQNAFIGEVKVVRGSGELLPDKDLTLGGGVSTSRNIQVFRGSLEGVGPDFDFNVPTPNTVDGVFNANTGTLDFDLAAPQPGTGAFVDLHIENDGLWTSAYFEIEFGGGVTDQAARTQHTGGHTNDLQIYNVNQQNATTLTITTSAGATSGTGSIQFF